MVESANNAVTAQGKQKSLRRVGQSKSPKRAVSPTKEIRKEVQR